MLEDIPDGVKKKLLEIQEAIRNTVSPGWKTYIDTWKKLEEETIVVPDAFGPSGGPVFFKNKKYFIKLEPGQYWSQVPGGGYVLKEKPMGKTSKPLTILIDPSIADWPEWEALREKGHTVVSIDTSVGDLVMGPRCWRMNDMTRKYLDLAIDWSRKEKYPSDTSQKGGPGPSTMPSPPAPESEPTEQ